MFSFHGTDPVEREKLKMENCGNGVLGEVRGIGSRV